MKKGQLQQEQWQEFMQQLTEVAIKKYGNGFRIKIHEHAGINKNRLSRIFKNEYPPRLNSIFDVLNALDLEITLKKKRKKRC